MKRSAPRMLIGSIGRLALIGLPLRQLEDGGGEYFSSLLSLLRSHFMKHLATNILQLVSMNNSPEIRKTRSLSRLCFVLTFVAITAIFLSACGPNMDDMRLKKAEAENVELKKQMDYLKQELDSISRERNEFKDQIKKLSKTPQNFLNEIAALLSAGNIDEAQKTLGILQFDFPKAPEGEQAYRLVKEFRAKLEKQQVHASQLAALGFKALKPTSLVDTGGSK